MTPPDSGEREVAQGPLTGLRLEARILAGAILTERRSLEDGLLHHRRGCNGESADGICDGGCALELAQRIYSEMGLRAVDVSLPLSLAQRILAALEECGEVVGPGIIFPRHTALADEMRAIVERK